MNGESQINGLGVGMGLEWACGLMGGVWGWWSKKIEFVINGMGGGVLINGGWERGPFSSQSLLSYAFNTQMG